jgi:hypothetical protein
VDAWGRVATGRRRAVGSLAIVLVSVVRLAIAGWVLVALGRASRGAWAHRRLILTIWSRVRPRHVVGGVVLLVAVVTVASGLIAWVPGADLGIGTLLGTSSNAVFTPLEEAVARTGPAPTGGVDWALLVLSTGFLLPLAVLLPWLAFVEEEVFRAGLEDATLVGEVRAALVFGLAHLVMLVPVGAALAVGGCGWFYGRVYRRAHALGDGSDVPSAALRSYRPTSRSRRAAERARTPRGVLVAAGVGGIEDRSPERRQAGAVLASAVWHTTFNTMVVVVVWATLVAAALDGGG